MLLEHLAQGEDVLRAVRLRGERGRDGSDRDGDGAEDVEA
jgi:hypothetical protein